MSVKICLWKQAVGLVRRNKRPSA